MLMTAISIQGLAGTGHYFKHLVWINLFEPPAKLVTIISLSLMRKLERRWLDYVSQCEQFQETGRLRLELRLTHVTEDSVYTQISFPPLPQIKKDSNTAAEP